MTDLTDRLRRNGEIEAADEIDRLTAALDDARASEEGALMILAQTIVERDSERTHANMLAQALAAIDTKGELDAEIAQLESAALCSKRTKPERVKK